MMKEMKSKTLAVTLLVFALIIPLLWSIFRSGYFYQFDIDELHHAHLVYLYSIGQRPYADIYNSVYSPLFEWILLSLFVWKGFSFGTIYLARIFMITLLMVRMSLTYILVKEIFQRRVALFSLLFFLLDPFVVFSSMQIRPDNLMITLWVVSLLALWFGMKRKRSTFLFASGLFASLSLLTLPKIFPSVFVTIVLLLFFGRTEKRAFSSWFTGAVVPLFLFTAYLISIGALPEMVQQVFIETKDAYSVFRYPIPLVNFHIPNNIYVYGLDGKPLTWVYAIALPFLAAAGLWQTFVTTFDRAKKKEEFLFPLILTLSLIVQFLSLLPLPVIFMQHFVPISWLLSIFAAVAIVGLFNGIRRFPMLHQSLAIVGGLAIGILMVVSIQANLARSAMISDKTRAKYERLWSRIGPNELVFPHLIFRPPVYPVPFGYYIGNVHPSVLSRLPDILTILEKKRVLFVLADDYTLSFFNKNLQNYITTNYRRPQGEIELWERKM